MAKREVLFLNLFIWYTPCEHILSDVELGGFEVCSCDFLALHKDVNSKIIFWGVYLL